MIAISNYADWFAPTSTTANEASVEASVETDATDLSAQDFAALLAASYATAPSVTAPSVAAPSVAAPTIGPSMTLESSVQSAQPAELRAPVLTTPTSLSTFDVQRPSPTTLLGDDKQIDARQGEAKGVPVDAAELHSFEAESALPNESEVRPLAMKRELSGQPNVRSLEPNTAPLNRIAVSPFEARKGDDGKGTAPTVRPAQRQEFTPIASTEVTSASAQMASRDAVFVNAPTTPNVAPANAPQSLSSSMQTPVARNETMPVLMQDMIPTSALPVVRNEAMPVLAQAVVPAFVQKDERLLESSAVTNRVVVERGIAPQTPTPALRAAVDRSLSALLTNTPLMEPVANLNQTIVTSAPANAPTTVSTAQSNPMDAATTPLTEIRVATAPRLADQAPPSISSAPTDSTAPTIEMKAERNPINIANMVTFNLKASPNPVSVANPPTIDVKVNHNPPLVATPAQSVISAQNALAAMLEPSASGVTAVVKMVAAVVKMIMAEPSHQNEILTTSTSTIASQSLSPEMLAPSAEAVSVPMTSVSVASQPVSLEAASSTLPASLHTPFDSRATPEQTPLRENETVEFPTSAPRSAKAVASVPLAVDDRSRAVSYEAEAALATTATSLGEREVFSTENSESVTRPQPTAVAASVKAPSPAASAAPPLPSSPIAQTMQPVLELAQRVPPQEARTLHFSLNPAELGRVDIEVTRDAQGRVSASLTVEQADTAQSLTHGIGQLRESLERAGMVVEHLQVTTQLQPQTNQQFNQQAGQQADQQQASSSYDPNADSLPTDSMLTEGPTSSSGNKLLSLHA